MLPVLETNREFVLEAIAHFRQHFDEIEEAITRRDFHSLSKILDRGAVRKEKLTGK